MQQSCRMFLPNTNFLLYCQNRFWKLHHQICYCTTQSIMTKIIISVLLNVSWAWKIDWARKANVMETHLVFLNISLNRSECPKIVCLATSSDILTVCGIYHQGTTCKFSLALGTLSLLSVFHTTDSVLKAGPFGLSIFLFLSMTEWISKGLTVRSH